MKRKYMLTLAGVAVAGLVGCAGSPDSQELSQTAVDYGCGPGGQQALSVQYTFRGDQAVSARVIHMNQVVDMARVTTGDAGMVGNTFKGGGYTWTTEKFDRDDVDSAAGNMLTVDTPPAVGYAPPPPAYGAPATGYPAHPPAATYGAAQGAYAAQPGAAHGAVAHGGVAPVQPGTVGTVLLRDCRPT